MLSKINKTTHLLGGLMVGTVIIITIMMSLSTPQTPQKSTIRYVNDTASADNKVEALKTLTAELITVEHKNQQLQQAIEHLHTENTQSLAHLKQSFSDQIQQAFKHIQRQYQAQQATRINRIRQKLVADAPDYPINGSSGNDSLTWLSDVSQTNLSVTNNGADSTGLLSINNTKHEHNTSLFHLEQDQVHAHMPSTSNDNPIQPVYTLPVNATLTGATLMTPLVGRVPIDGQLSSPYHFKLVLSNNNLTANGYPMPGIQGAVMGGIARGDMLGSCVRGDIHSITFIFNDGRISTTQAKGNNASLGYISSDTGNPCIAGILHSNAAIVLGAQISLASAQGYANALTNAQYMNTTIPAGDSIRTLIGNANKAALGQGGSVATQAAQTWWNRRVHNSFDYVYVPNVEKGSPMTVAVNITQLIPINYDNKARKVNYAMPLQTHSALLD